MHCARVYLAFDFCYFMCIPTKKRLVTQKKKKLNFCGVLLFGILIKLNILLLNRDACQSICSFFHIFFSGRFSKTSSSVCELHLQFSRWISDWFSAWFSLSSIDNKWRKENVFLISKLPKIRFRKNQKYIFKTCLWLCTRIIFDSVISFWLFLLSSSF